MTRSRLARLGDRRADKAALLIALSGLLVRTWVAPSLGYAGVDGDLIEHKQAMHLALTQGIAEIYRDNPIADPAQTGSEWDGAYFSNQPPLIYILRYLPVLSYRTWSPEGFSLWSETLNYYALLRSDLAWRQAASRGFTVALKVPGILADLAISLGLFAFTLPRAGRAAALAACAAHAVNPGIIVDTAFWGQHDAVAAGLVVLAFAWLQRARLELAWGAGALALLTKPQALAFAPLLVWLGVAAFSRARVTRATLAGLGAALLVFLPFLRHGTFLPSVRALWTSTVGGEPFVSCQAANLWWLVTGGEAYAYRDDVGWAGPITARALGLLGTVLVNVLLALALRRAPDPDGRRSFQAAGLAGLSFFMLATELHENHMLAALPLLALGWAGRLGWGPALGVLSGTFLLNLVLFDPALEGPVAAALGMGQLPVRPLSLGVAALNAIAWAGLLAQFLRAGAERPPSAMAPAEPGSR